MKVALDHAEFHASVASLHSACDAVATARSTARASVASLLDSSWTGAAASAFAEGWADWLAASAVLTSELDATATVLARIHGALTSVDDEASSSVSLLAERLG